VLKEMSARILIVIALAAMAGCTPDHVMETAPVTGKVFCAGEPVTEGYLVFTPIRDQSTDPNKSGKSGYATIQSDGTYIVTTYEEGDGALIGTHEVRIYKPDPEDDEQFIPDNFVCGDNTLEVAVEEGDNIIDLDPAEGATRRE